LFFDKKDIHGNGMRHVLMSNGRIYFLPADEFQKLQQNLQGNGD
jgi:exoribonuclease II